MQIPFVVQAADTVFIVPEISTTWDSPGMLYKSPNLDALAYKGSQGLVADIINNCGLEAALTDEVMQMITSVGWKKIEVYYPMSFS